MRAGARGRPRTRTRRLFIWGRLWPPGCALHAREGELVERVQVPGGRPPRRPGLALLLGLVVTSEPHGIVAPTFRATRQGQTDHQQCGSARLFGLAAGPRRLARTRGVRTCAARLFAGRYTPASLLSRANCTGLGESPKAGARDRESTKQIRGAVFGGALTVAELVAAKRPRAWTRATPTREVEERMAVCWRWGAGGWAVGIGLGGATCPS